MRSIFTATRRDTREGEVSRPWELSMGANVMDDGRVQFSVWAPRVKRLCVKVDDVIYPMEEGEEGLWRGIHPRGTDYSYLIDGEHARPDPVSRWQPFGVHGPSRIYDARRFAWTDQEWTGRPLKGSVFYELHVGTFTPEGNFEAIIPKLSYLKELGVTTISLMPVAQFPGSRNWGYDGVDLYAPHSAYGGPDGLKALVDAAHQLGLSCFLDVVYNHLGLEGNYLHDYGPYFTDRYKTPWAEAINFDGPYSHWVRAFFIENALYWMSEYHIDGLRLDAVHAIYDFGAQHILEELQMAVQRQAKRLGRTVHLVAESDLNDVRLLNPRDKGGYGLDAQWHDDFHHAAVTAVTGRKEGYFADFGTLADLAKAIEEGYVVDGRFSSFRKAFHGSSAKERPADQFVAFIQNHDQIANASQGKRIASRVSLEQQRLLAALLICSPMLPMLFMGEEWAASTPFHYFTSYTDPHLSQVIAESRQGATDEHGFLVEPYNPQDGEVFAQCKLNWEERIHEPHHGMLGLYRDLLALRRESAALHNCRKDLSHLTISEVDRWCLLERRDPSGSSALLVCNLKERAQEVPVPGLSGQWKKRLETSDSRYGGSRSSAPDGLGSATTRISLQPFGAALYTASTLNA